MRKAIYIFAVVSMLSFSVMPALAGTPVSTGFTADTTGGQPPVVKAKWEMLAATSTNPITLSGLDDSPAAGAQFMPSGQYNVHKNITLCAIVTDPDGLADINNVYGDVFYPVNINLGPSHVKLPSQNGDPRPTAGCGALMQEDRLTRLSKTDGIELFCNRIRNNNNNLPTFNTPSTTYNYNEICKADGELQKETAAVYCKDKVISYEDPSGDYRVVAIAQDKVGKTGTLENYFTYLTVTAFETDFDQIVYGDVRLNTHKIISGDLNWNTLNGGKASVRNTGNTRLYMWVQQDDMGLGKTGSDWNVLYDARVGSDALFANYSPGYNQWLYNSMDLSELNEMDFSIDVFKFPTTHPNTSYTGTMTLSATIDAHLTGPCQD